MSDLFWLTDAQIARLEPFFPESYGTVQPSSKPQENVRLPGCELMVGQNNRLDRRL